LNALKHSYNIEICEGLGEWIVLPSKLALAVLSLFSSALPMPFISWHDWILVISSIASVAGLYFYGRSPIKVPSEAEAAQETLVRLTFVYWIVYCCAHWGEQACTALSPSLTCSLRLLMLLSYLLTFCCALSMPLHLIEQRRRQAN
jgi:hypothetical protein